MPDAQLNLWANIISGTVAGLVSGLLVSFTLWAISHFSKPKFEYYDIGEGIGHFFYNRYPPIIVGGSFVLGHGPALIERTPRGGYGGFYLGPMGDQVFSTTTHPDLSIALPTGDTPHWSVFMLVLTVQSGFMLQNLMAWEPQHQVEHAKDTKPGAKIWPEG